MEQRSILTVLVGATSLSFALSAESADAIIKMLRGQNQEDKEAWIELPSDKQKSTFLKRDQIVAYQVQAESNDRYEKNWITIKDLADIFQVNPITITKKYKDTLQREKKNKKLFSRPTLETALALRADKTDSNKQKYPSTRNLEALFAGKKTIEELTAKGTRK